MYIVQLKEMLCEAVRCLCIAIKATRVFNVCTLTKQLNTHAISRFTNDKIETKIQWKREEKSTAYKLLSIFCCLF